MSTSSSFAEFVCEQLAGAGAASVRRMFGEYALYLDGRTVGLLVDQRVYVKVVATTPSWALKLPREAPFPGAKDWIVADELLDDGPRLGALVAATALGVEVKAPKRPRVRRKQ